MDFSSKKDDGILVLAFKGRLSSVTFPQEIEVLLDEMIDDEKVAVILDLQEVGFVDSSGLSTLLAILTKTRNAGGETVLINVPKTLNNLLLLTKLNAIFTVKDSVEAAKEIFLTTKT